jgi:hypothetical protein
MSARNAVVWGLACLPLVLPMRSFGQAGAPRSMDAKDAILEAGREIANAKVHQDLATLDRLFEDNYSHTHSSGRIQSKAEYMESIRTGKSSFKAFEVSNQTVHFFGNIREPHVATVTGRYHIVTADGSHDNTFLEVWVLQTGEKQVSGMADVRIKGTWRCAGVVQVRLSQEKSTQ